MTRRKPHLLQPLSKVTRPTRVIFVDTETTASQLPNEIEYHKLKLGYALHCKSTSDEYLRVQSDCVIFDNVYFWGWIDNLCYDKSTIYMVAHNWHFDSTVLNTFEFLPSLGFELTQWYVKATTFIMHWQRKNTHLVMVDNGNIYHTKLAVLGELVGYPKLDVDFSTVSDEELLTYCKRDVEIMRQGWIKWLQFLDDHDCGDFRYTVASQAMETFRYRFMKKYIHIHADEQAMKLERDSYHGGRVEARFVGTTNNNRYTYLDINNMYGYVMANNSFPCGFTKIVNNPKIEYLEYMLTYASVIARVELQTTSNPFPYVNGHSLFYPTGHFTTTLCTPELRYALDHDWIVNIEEMSIYPHRPMFKEYIEYFYSERMKYKDNNDDIFGYICKLFNNSLYGKFGQLQTESKKVGHCPIDAVGVLDLQYPDLKKKFDLVYLGGSIFEVEKTGDAYNSFVAIASHVTSYARMHLWSLIEQVSHGHFFYCDTDSLVVDAVGEKSLSSYIDTATLGYLKREDVSSWLTINGPKDYAMENRIRIKGISTNAKLIAPNTYKQQRWPKLPSRIREGNLEDYQIHMQVKHLKRNITWGVPTSSGWVEPFVLE